VRLIHFSAFELDLQLFTLQRDGLTVDIGRRPLDLLICLIQNHERVVDLEFLRREVWNSAALSPAAIPTCVRELRRILGDDASSPDFIESKRGRGYRFIAEVTRGSGPTRALGQPLEEFPFVGRAVEMSTIRNAVRSTITQARGHLILIRGEAGIGKTRLLSMFLQGLTPNVRRFVARGSNIEGTPAFWPWTQILREALASQQTENRELVENAQSLSTAFPEIQGSVDSALPRPAKLDRFSILSQWARTIRSISPSRPLLLAFEDIHRTDFDSLSLLAWIAEELSSEPIIFVATHRPYSKGDATTQGLSDIATVPNCISIDLPPLTAKDISFMLDPLEVDRSILSEALRLRTSGNPFYVTHLIRYLDARADFESAESLVSALPSNGREIVSRQLSDLPASTREALAVASVAGGTFSISTTAATLKIGPAELITQLEPARRAWLIREDGGNFVFSHALLREALYQTIDAYRRRSIHLLLAQILIEQTNSLSNSAQISDHLMKAIPLGEYSQACRFALLAGREAIARYAFSEAQIYFQRALKILGASSEPRTTDRCRMMLELASAQLYAGDRGRARKTLLDAAQLARLANSSPLLAACALELAPDYLSIIVGAYDLVLVQLLEEALASTPSTSLSLRSKLLARLSQAIQWAGDPDRHAQMTIEALALARKADDRDALAAALSARAEYLRGPIGANDRIVILAELYEITRVDNNVADRLLQKTQMITALLELGDLARLDAENESCREIAFQTGLPHFMWHAESTDSMRALMRGEIKANVHLADRYQQVQRLTKDANVTQEFAAQEIFRQVEMDRSREVLPFVVDFAQQQQLVLTWSAALAWIQWDAGYFTESLATLARLGSSGIEAQSRETGGGIGIGGLAELISKIGEREDQELLYQLIAPIRNCSATAGYGWLYFGSFARYSGLLADSLGFYSDAVEDLRQAIIIESKRGAQVWQGYAEIDLTVVLHRAGAPSDAISTALDAARRTVKKTESPRLLRRFLTILDQLDPKNAFENLDPESLLKK
jgi:DNA-binding winged helix-turn-helix (wHTH) protein